MNHNIRSKILLFLSLLISICFSFPASASSLPTTPISDEQHKQIITNYLNQIEAMHNQVDAIAQVAISEPQEDCALLCDRITVINTNIENLNSLIQDYLATNPGVSERNKHIILTFNFINLVKSNLYNLSQLIHTTSSIDRFLLLNEYFTTRANALSTLDILRNILAKY
jgi:hypothetical protein